MTSAIVTAYDEYVAARVEARRAARERVTAELRPHLAAFGKVVQEAQNDGLSIAEVARVLDIKNRNFIYDAKRAYAEDSGEEYKVREYVRSPKAVPGGGDGLMTKPKPQYEVEVIGDDCFEVKAFGEDYFITTDEDGHLIFPEEWADLSAQERVTVKAIIADLKGRV